MTVSKDWKAVYFDSVKQWDVDAPNEFGGLT